MKIVDSNLPIVGTRLFHSVEKWYGTIYRCRRQRNKLIGFVWVCDSYKTVDITNCLWDNDKQYWVL